MMPIGGIAGTLLASYFTQHYDPRWSFLIISAVTFIQFIFTLLLDETKLGLFEEQTHRQARRRGFSEQMRQNSFVIKEALQEKHMWRFVVYLIGANIICPSFSYLHNYFQIDVVGFSRTELAYLAMMGSFTLLIGSTVHTRYF